MKNNTFHGIVSTEMDSEESLLQKVAISIPLAFVIVVASGLILEAFALNRQLRQSAANFLILSQALCDLVTAVVFIPIYLIGLYTKSPGGIPFLIGFIMFLSLFNLLALAIDRYLVLSQPFWYKSVISVRRIVKLLCLIWSVPLFLTSIPLCWWFLPKHAQASAGHIYHAIMWVIMLLLVISMGVIYVFVILAAKRAVKLHCAISLVHSNKASLKCEMRGTKLFACLLFFFILAYVPVLYTNFCDVIKRHDWVPVELENSSYYCFVFNSVVNPFLCICLKKDYQVVVKRQLKRTLRLKGSHDVSNQQREYLVLSRLASIALSCNMNASDRSLNRSIVSLWSPRSPGTRSAFSELNQNFLQVQSPNSLSPDSLHLVEENTRR